MKKLHTQIEVSQIMGGGGGGRGGSGNSCTYKMIRDSSRPSNEPGSILFILLRAKNL